ncbi:hypothetical protein SSP35_22_00460 [Streptomyces sp. NBRC 110611]|uniref:DUF317 domain-containing protein n=1 Tax=Streptomyces sp. NBRC 110611 TaxID=1621259 RepID=UPI000856BA47|nr:DUF317 domain-containing protein [Streptomyces sp. NBRC 110611]GAU70743.1 hypothetical protein SSP35_22_00460 [Streptomyces sp. NBRC 110611]
MTRAAREPLPPEREVLAAPVALAGSGHLGLVTGLLKEAPGWTTALASDGARYYTSPCQRIRISHNSPPLHAYEPAARETGWKIAYSDQPLYGPSWMAFFGRETPGEIVHAVVRRLVRGDPERFLDGDNHAAPDSTLADHGWSKRHTPGWDWSQDTWLSPDDHTSVTSLHGDTYAAEQLRDNEPGSWILRGYTAPDAGSLWRTDFTEGTPAHLINQALAVLTDPAPVRRSRQHLPSLSLPYLTTKDLPAEHTRPVPPRAATASRTPPPPPAGPGSTRPRR